MSNNHTSPADIQSQINNIISRLEGKKLALFLDFDGTLAEVQEIADDTYMTSEMSKVLQSISQAEDVSTIPISGRKADDLKARVGVDSFLYSGNHGMEMDINGGKISYCLSDSEIELLRKGIKKVKHTLLKNKLGKERGGNVEDKDTALTWHYFKVPEAEKEATVKEACAIIEAEGFIVFHGVGCLEVRDAFVTKAHAMRRIVAEKFGSKWSDEYFSIFIGDGQGDEESYLALEEDEDFHSENMTFIRVQEKPDPEQPTEAPYVFKTVADVQALLQAIDTHYNKKTGK